MDFLIPLVEEFKETEQELFEFNEKEKERIYNLFKKKKKSDRESRETNSVSDPVSDPVSSTQRQRVNPTLVAIDRENKENRVTGYSFSYPVCSAETVKPTPPNHKPIEAKCLEARCQFTFRDQPGEKPSKPSLPTQSPGWRPWTP